MPTQNSTENVLRFQQLRPAVAVTGDGPIVLAGHTKLVEQLVPLDRVGRTTLALASLSDGAIDGVLGWSTTQTLLSTVASAVDDDVSVGELASNLDLTADERIGVRDATSDLLIATKFASVGHPRLEPLLTAFRAIASVLDENPDVRQLSVRATLRRALVLPPNLTPAPSGTNDADAVPRRPRRASASRRPSLVSRAAMRASVALNELAALVDPAFLNLPADAEQGKTWDEADAAPAPFTVNQRGLRRLTKNTRDLLDELGIDPGQSIDSIVSDLALEVSLHADASPDGEPPNPPPPDPPVDLPYLKSVGVTDLLVVKQHLTGYDRVDIAHIENVLIGETKSRTHRALERIEESLTQESETTTERETELTTAERFELNREMTRTVQRDQEFGFGLTLSGKYGPSVDFSATLQSSSSTSSDETSTSATKYAKDVTERSLERVVERVREEQIRRVTRELEETNLHELQNITDEHISGVYQFVEKVYETQIFNYGIREMFDFIVPEPASYLWYLETTDTQLNLPAPPPRLDTFAADATAITPANYLSLAALFDADGIGTPPPIFITGSCSITHGETADDDGEEGHPRSVTEKTLSVPPGYRPYRALVSALALTDDSLTIGVTIGHRQRVWSPGGGNIIDIGEGHDLGQQTLELSLLEDSFTYEQQSKLAVQTLAFETNSFSVVADVIFIRTDDALREWQIDTYEKLANAYRDSVTKYEAIVADLKAEAEADAPDSTSRFGAPPSQNLKTIKTELKKHCISFVTRQRYESFDIVQSADPPYFDFDTAAERGSFLRFFEQAFEWDQLQYVFYPYFWSGAEGWSQRFLRQDVDPAFLEFLQAGAARVVVPVRPGFEVAITHYLETLHIWDGMGQPPPINSDLYVPIITELEERTGAGQGEVPMGEPWETRVPTPLAILRPDDDLPRWRRPDPQKWEWEEVDGD